ncbi:hypothetical protein I4U23_030841 [Adineta vaga]|nr:hypothetical protein I4U23_030841 [Adineta vaga]
MVTDSSANNNYTLRLSTDSSEDRDYNNNIIQTSDQNPSSKKTNSTNKRRTSRSQQSGLVFSVSRVENHLRNGRYAPRISPKAAVFLAGVLEYLVADILELAGDMTFIGKRKRVTPRDITLAIKNDHELAKLCPNVTIPEGGVQPYIHEVLLNKKPRRRTRRVRFDETSFSNKNKSTTPDYDTDDSDVQME